MTSGESNDESVNDIKSDLFFKRVNRINVFSLLGSFNGVKNKMFLIYKKKLIKLQSTNLF